MIPTGLARALLKAPGLERLARAPLAFLEAFNHLALYNCRHTLTLLSRRPVDVRCPPFDSYVDPLVRYVREVQARRSRRATRRRSTRSTWYEAALMRAYRPACCLSDRLLRHRRRGRSRRPATTSSSPRRTSTPARSTTSTAASPTPRASSKRPIGSRARRRCSTTSASRTTASSDSARALDAYRRFLAAASPDNPDRDFSAKRVELAAARSSASIDHHRRRSTARRSRSTAPSSAPRRSARRSWSTPARHELEIAHEGYATWRSRRSTSAVGGSSRRSAPSRSIGQGRDRRRSRQRRRRSTRSGGCGPRSAARSSSPA